LFYYLFAKYLIVQIKVNIQTYADIHEQEIEKSYATIDAFDSLHFELTFWSFFCFTVCEGCITLISTNVFFLAHKNLHLSPCPFWTMSKSAYKFMDQRLD